MDPEKESNKMNHAYPFKVWAAIVLLTPPLLMTIGSNIGHDWLVNLFMIYLLSIPNAVLIALISYFVCIKVANSSLPTPKAKGAVALTNAAVLIWALLYLAMNGGISDLTGASETSTLFIYNAVSLAAGFFFKLRRAESEDDFPKWMEENRRQ